MKEKPSIKKIVFNVNGKTLELSKDEAKELKDILSDLFGETKHVHHYDSWWTRPYTGPYWTYTYSGNLSGGTGTLTNCTASTTDTIYLNTAN